MPAGGPDETPIMEIVNIPVLLIDDDLRLCELLKTYLSGHGFQVSVANNVKEGMRQLRSGSFDLVLLDIMLPDGDGLDVCKKIRVDSPVPIIMLTARGADEDKIIGLELGADDYLAKPFNPRELVARAKAVLRRKGGAPDWSGNLQSIEYDQFQLIPQNQKLVVRGKAIDLTSAEFRLLKILASNPGKVFTRERLMDLVSGRDFDGVDRSIDVHISRLRNKIEPDPRNPRWIKTVWGTGYRFQS
jgi:two-component system, OmpR family, phosphate regulon response regulator OmpR